MLDTPTEAMFPQSVEVLLAMLLIKLRSNLKCKVWMQSFIWRRSCTLSIRRLNYVKNTSA